VADETPFMQIAHGRTSDELVYRLEELILDGILRDGDKLPGERELAQRFDVSRPILREALKELEIRGLLVSKHGGGTYVADIVGEVFSKPLSALITRHSRATRDYLEYRRQMEGMTAELAAMRATDTDKQMLGRIIADMQNAHDAGRFEDELAYDVEFHNAIGEAAHNIVLMHTMRACYRLLNDDIFYNRHLIFTVDGAHKAVMGQHVAIHDAICANDAAGAKHAAQAHIDFIVETTQRAEQSEEWNRISRLRLRQRGI
jgi:GntR family transcriptional repressor for pyruvate dehydrogenase complex